MEIWLWVGFISLVILLLALDLGVFNRTAHVISAKEALLWTGFWIFLSLLFNGLIYFMYQHHWLGIGEHFGHDVSGSQAALNYFTGYIIEKSLSLDNIFVIALIFNYFGVMPKYQHRVLFWGILGAIVMRGLMIAAGVTLVQKFVWMIYVFGVFLIFTAVRMLLTKHEKVEPEKNPLVKLAQKMFPITSQYKEHHFFARLENNKHAITPMFLVLLVIESTDVMFAVDSIPAIFAVTTDPFIVFTSNIFAILGLRSLYFALAAVINKFRYLKISLVFILGYVGVKMLLSHTLPIPTLVSLAIISIIITTGIFASIKVRQYEEAEKNKSLKV